MTDVLYLLGSLDVGGTERQMSLVLPELARRGWAIEVMVLSGEGAFGEPLRAAGIPVGKVPFRPAPAIPRLRGFLNMRAQAAALARRLRSAPPKILHCFLPTCCVVGGWAARTAGFAPVAMSRRSQANRPSLHPGDKWLETRALRRADLVFGHSRWVLSDLQAEGIAPERLTLVHNGVAIGPQPDDALRAAVRAELGWAAEEVVGVVVANLHRYKGHGHLLRGVAAMMQGRTDWRLAFVGSGSAEYTNALRMQVAEAGLAQNVAFLGRRLDVPRILAAADIGLLPSDHEGFSNGLLEYMVAGLPVIATATGGNLDAVEDGRSGYLVPVADGDALGRAFASLVGDPGLRQQFGAASRAKVEAEFSLKACVSGYEAAYRALLQGPPLIDRLL